MDWSGTGTTERIGESRVNQIMQPIGIGLITLGGLLMGSAAIAQDRILSVDGSATLRRQGITRQANPGEALSAGDLLIPSTGSQVRIRCANNRIEVVRNRRGLGAICPDSVASRYSQRSRGQDDFLAFLNGQFVYATQVIEAQPLLRWAALSESPSAYRVQVIAVDTLLWERVSEETQLRYDGPPLQPGESYDLVITPTNATTPQIIALRRLSETETAAIRRQIEALETDALTDEAIAIAQAQIYQTAAQPNTPPPAGIGLIWEAIAQLEPMAAASRSPSLHRHLGDLYLQVGLLDQAAREYEQVIQLIQTVTDPVSRAAASIGLANIAAANGSLTEAELWLKLARIDYLYMNESDRVDTIQQWLERLNLFRS